MTEDELKSKIDLANTVPFQYSSDIPLSEYGNYSYDFSKNKGTISINDLINPEFAKTVGTHEITHATGLDNIYSKKAGKNLTDENGNKVYDYEAYPDIMQMRHTLNLKPGKQVTDKELKKLEDEGDINLTRMRDRGYTDEQILSFFNTWAANKNKKYTLQNLA
jgi:hypothetical protein